MTVTGLRYGAELGLRPTNAEDLMRISDGIYDTFEAIFEDIGDCILSGIVESGGDTLSAGTIVIGGEICNYPGETGLTFPCKLLKTETATSLKTYGDAASKATQTLFSAKVDGSGTFDIDASGDGKRLEDAIKINDKDFEYSGDETRTGDNIDTGTLTNKGVDISFLNTTSIALTSSKFPEFIPNLGNIIEITGDITDYTIDRISSSLGVAHGQKLSIQIGGSQNITITHTASGNFYIITLTGEDMIFEPGTVIEFINEPDTGGDSIWRMLTISKLPIATADDYGVVKLPLKTKIIEIGDWDMTNGSTLTIDVAHGITNWKTVRSISVIIRNDDDDLYHKLEAISATESETWAGVNSFDATNITLFTGAYNNGFYNTDYNSTSYNRGWITVEYTD